MKKKNPVHGRIIKDAAVAEGGSGILDMYYLLSN